jgi:hypothetical protein
LKSLDRGFAKSAAPALQIIDFKGITKNTEPWVVKEKLSHVDGVASPPSLQP